MIEAMHNPRPGVRVITNAEMVKMPQPMTSVMALREEA
jgi:hypothetical protein